MTKPLELVGQKFGHLTVVSKRANSKSGNTRWFCKCSCGNAVIISGGILKYKVRSCGCVHGLTPQEYIKSKVRIDPITGCWIWQASTRCGGYGQAKWRSETWMSHRLAYVAFVGPIQKNKFVCHNCPVEDNPLCCNPDHLFLGTNSDNIKDMYEKKKMRE